MSMKASYQNHSGITLGKRPVKKYNIAFETASGRKCLYLVQAISSYSEALEGLRRFRRKYVNQPLPNGRGYYDFRNIRITEKVVKR